MEAQIDYIDKICIGRWTTWDPIHLTPPAAVLINPSRNQQLHTATMRVDHHVHVSLHAFLLNM